jgi:hypothetical protein
MVMSGVVVRTITPARNPIVPREALFATGARRAEDDRGHDREGFTTS